MDRDLLALRMALDAMGDAEVIQRAYELLAAGPELDVRLEQLRWEEFFRIVDEIVVASRTSLWIRREELVNQLRRFCELEELRSDGLQGAGFRWRLSRTPRWRPR